jgi:hypothetical protein
MVGGGVVECDSTAFYTMVPPKVFSSSNFMDFGHIHDTKGYEYLRALVKIMGLIQGGLVLLLRILRGYSDFESLMTICTTT